MILRSLRSNPAPQARALLATVGDQLLDVLVNRNQTHRLTRQQICDHLGVNRRELDDALNGSADLKLSRLLAIAESLGAEVKVEIRLAGP